MTVLVLTRRDDLTADWVVDHLYRLDVKVARVDLAEFPAKARLRGTITSGGGWPGMLRTEHQNIDLDQVRAVYYRRPALFRFPGEMSEDAQQWCADEARHGLGGLLAALPHARWGNPVDRVLAVERKPGQLATAIAVGLAIPPTLITNDPDEARTFASTQPRGIYGVDLSSLLAGGTAWGAPSRPGLVSLSPPPPPPGSTCCGWIAPIRP